MAATATGTEGDTRVLPIYLTGIMAVEVKRLVGRAKAGTADER